jgi:hypothetical protein
VKVNEKRKGDEGEMERVCVCACVSESVYVRMRVCEREREREIFHPMIVMSNVLDFTSSQNDEAVSTKRCSLFQVFPI